MNRIFTSILMAGFMVWVMATFNRGPGTVHIISDSKQYYRKSKCDKAAKLKQREYYAPETYVKCVQIPLIKQK